MIPKFAMLSLSLYVMAYWDNQILMDSKVPNFYIYIYNLHREMLYEPSQ